MKLQLLVSNSRYSVVTLTSTYNNFTNITKNRVSFSFNSYQKKRNKHHDAKIDENVLVVIREEEEEKRHQKN